MARVKVKVYSESNVDSLHNIANKLIMNDQANGMMLFRDVKIIKEEEHYGRKKNKVRVNIFVECEVLGYNRNGKFVGAFDKDTVSRILLMYDLYKMRRLYLDHIEALEAMQAEEAKLNETLN